MSVNSLKLIAELVKYDKEVAKELAIMAIRGGYADDRAEYALRQYYNITEKDVPSREVRKAGNTLP